MKRITAEEYEKLCVLDTANFEARCEWQNKWNEVFDKEDRTMQDFEKLGPQPPVIASYLITSTTVDNEWDGNLLISRTSFYWDLERIKLYPEGVEWAKEHGFDFIPKAE